MSDAGGLRRIGEEPDENEFRARLTSRLDGGAAGTCPDPALLLASRSDAVPEELRRQALGHLERCPICQALMRDVESPEFAELGAGRARAIRERIPAAVGRHARGRKWWWAAVPLAAGLAIAMIYFGGLGARRTEMTLKPAASVPAAPALRPLILAHPPIQLPATALLFRGEGEPDANQLLKAMGAFRERKYDLAAQRLGVLAAKDPEAMEVHLYLGVALLFLDRAGEAVNPLETARKLADGPLVREVEWYLAVAHQKRGAFPEATRMIEALCGSTGAHREEACAALSPSAKE